MAVIIHNWALVHLELQKHFQGLSMAFIVQITTHYVTFLYRVVGSWSIDLFYGVSRTEPSRPHTALHSPVQRALVVGLL